MRTFELLIVLGALMALIALVAIGIDWIGKPLRGRRFLPRIYRYDDEKLPVDALGNPAVGPLAGPPLPMAAAPMVPPPIAHVTAMSTASTDAVPSPLADAVASHSAFSDSLAVVATPPSGVAPAPTETDADLSPAVWRPGMALDLRVGDRRPTLANKAERFWRATGQAMSQSHFDDEDHKRMASGKPPRRHNPRTGRAETMQLVGLRQASHESEVRMRWPDDSVDPWSVE